MKVLFVLEDLLIGGAQRHTVDLAKALSQDITCEVMSVNDLEPKLVEGVAGIDITALNLRVLKPKSWPKLGDAIRAAQPDLIVSINQVATLGVTAAGFIRDLGAPRAVIFHTTRVAATSSWIRIIPFVPAARTADAFVYISHNQRRIWARRGLGSRRTVTIRNGVHDDRYTPPTPEARAEARASLGYGPEDFVIGIAAIMRREKNHGQLIDALAGLRARGLPAHVLVIGDGPTRSEVEAQAQRLGLADYVKITGLQSDVRPHLSAIDIGVLCSASIETLSLSALETMAMSIPMVMSETGGASEIVDHGQNGFLFDVGDTAGLIDCLARAATAPLACRAMGEAALAKVRDQFTYKRMANDYLALFQDLAAQGKRYEQPRV